MSVQQIHTFNKEIPSQSPVPNQEIKDGKFQAKWYNPIPDDIVKRIDGKSYKPDSPVSMKDLAYFTITHWNFEGEIVTGELVSHKNLAEDILQIFLELFKNSFPIHQMVLIDNYGADDDCSMLHNNTWSFCTKEVTNKPGIYSKHSWGIAFDINPVQNPYICGDQILLETGKQYVDRNKNIPGLITHGDPCYLAFTKRGFEWGGDLVGDVIDNQHFQKYPEDVIGPPSDSKTAK